MVSCRIASHRIESSAPLACQVLQKVHGKPKRLRAAFRAFDGSSTGTVTPHDFKQVSSPVSSLSPPVSAFDSSSTGTVTPRNFKQDPYL